MNNSQKSMKSMNAIIIYHVHNDWNNWCCSLPEQGEKLIKYCQKRGFNIIGKFSLNSQPYKEQQNSITKIRIFIGMQTNPVAICFDQNNQDEQGNDVVNAIFCKHDLKLFMRAIYNHVELHFMHKSKDWSNKFKFENHVMLDKYHPGSTYPVIEPKDEWFRKINI